MRDSEIDIDDQYDEEDNRTPEQKLQGYLLLAGAIPGPAWPDLCEHSPQAYVATYECLLGRLADGRTPIDLYVWENHRGGQEVCLRCGPESSDYHSPNAVTRLAEDRAYEPYATAYNILQLLGSFRWVPNRPASPMEAFEEKKPQTTLTVYKTLKPGSIVRLPSGRRLLKLDASDPHVHDVFELSVVDLANGYIHSMTEFILLTDPWDKQFEVEVRA